MKQITNLQLLNAVLQVIFLVGMVIILYPLNSTMKALSFFVLLIVISTLFAFISSISQRRLKNKESVLFQPVSTRTSTILINSVVGIWLCVVGLIVFMILNVRAGSPEMVISVFLSLLVGVVFGRYLQRRFSKKSLLSYGISSFFALVIIVVAFVVI